jgi:hypothetical protein
VIRLRILRRTGSSGRTGLAELWFAAQRRTLPDLAAEGVFGRDNSRTVIAASTSTRTARLSASTGRSQPFATSAIVRRLQARLVPNAGGLGQLVQHIPSVVDANSHDLPALAGVVELLSGQRVVVLPLAPSRLLRMPVRTVSWRRRRLWERAPCNGRRLHQLVLTLAPTSNRAIVRDRQVLARHREGRVKRTAPRQYLQR